MYSRCSQLERLSRTYLSSQVELYEAEQSGGGATIRVEAGVLKQFIKRPLKGTGLDFSKHRRSSSHDTVALHRNGVAESTSVSVRIRNLQVNLTVIQFSSKTKTYL